jgi:pyruvate kinase
VVALSPSQEVVRQCQLLWGVHPRINTEPLQTLDLMDRCADAAREMGLAGIGDKIGITAGLPAGTSGGTNLFKVHTIE